MLGRQVEVFVNFIDRTMVGLLQLHIAISDLLHEMYAGFAAFGQRQASGRFDDAQHGCQWLLQHFSRSAR